MPINRIKGYEEKPRRNRAAFTLNPMGPMSPEQQQIYQMAYEMAERDAEDMIDGWPAAECWN